MSIVEIKQAVKTLSPEELAEISAFIAQCEAEAWDRQIDGDFSEGGRLRPVLEEVRGDLRAGRIQELP
ncbi:MAG: hypothetical protein HY736_02830 [Verrucomicrobia bacterium]|nr:hypothetical protein [Verrucomicrobiota bacterium]